MAPRVYSVVRRVVRRLALDLVPQAFKLPEIQLVDSPSRPATSTAEKPELIGQTTFVTVQAAAGESRSQSISDGIDCVE